MNEAMTSTRNLNTLVRWMLKFNVNMSHKLRSIKRMHSALAVSTASLSDSLRINAQDSQRAISSFKFAFEEDLQISRIYKRVVLNELRFFKSSFSNSIAHFFLSGLSLSNVFDISVIFLSIFSMKLWNHHRYSFEHERKTDSDAFSFEAWYNSLSMIRQSFQQLCNRES